MKLNKITGEEDFENPIFLLFLFSMMFVWEAYRIIDNLNTHESIILSEPVLFTDSILSTTLHFCWFLIPACIFYYAIKERHIFLKLTYILGTLPLIFTAPLINKLGYTSLYFIKILLIFAVIMCLMKYLINTMDLYKEALNQMKKTDNRVAGGF